MALFTGLRGYLGELWQAWNKFWFTPIDPATLSFIRLLAGSMMFYTHLVWSLDLTGFIGPNGYTPVDLVQAINANSSTTNWSVQSIFFYIHPTWLLWTVHIFALVVFACLAMGLFSRTAAVLGYILAMSYAQRVTPGAYFGLDKTNCMIAMYLWIGPCGARYSLDRIRALRRGDTTAPPPSTGANLALRLLQIHLCIVYFFSGIAKLEGDSWKLGTALLWAGFNYEYQSFSLTWFADHQILAAILTHVTVFWETTYAFLVWNRFTRPLVLWTAVAVHAGIAVFMGMITFGLAMIFANLSFLRPSTVRKWFDPIAGRISVMLTGKKVA